jgi:hypothetical protein
MLVIRPPHVYNLGKNMRRLFRNIHPNLKTYDENVSIFQLKQLSTLNPPPPPPTYNVGSGKVDLQHMSPTFATHD